MIRKRRVPSRVFAMLALSALLSGCGSRHESDAKEAVKSRLSDPDSAKFAQIIVYDTKVVCGEVNAKNRIGGYTGNQVFIYNGGVLKNVELDVKQYEISEWCQDVLPTLATLEKLCATASLNTGPADQQSVKEICGHRDKYKKDLGARIQRAKS